MYFTIVIKEDNQNIYACIDVNNEKEFVLNRQNLLAGPFYTYYLMVDCITGLTF